MPFQFLLLMLFALTLAPLTAPAKAAAPLFIASSSYAKLSLENKSQYLKKARQIMAQLEQDLTPDPRITRHNFYQDLLVSPAFAEEFCMMGGVKRPYQNRKCSSFANGCSETKDGFQCGAVFSSACIERLPVDSISQRCFIASNEKPLPTAEEYARIKLQAEADFESLCLDTARADTPACRNFTTKMADLNKKMSAPGTPARAATAESEAAPLKQVAKFVQDLSFRKEVNSLADLKKLANSNEEKAEDWAHSCQTDVKKDIAANAISIKFDDGYEQMTYPLSMFKNEDGSFALTLGKGERKEVRILTSINGLFTYQDAQGRSHPVKIYQIHPRFVNMGLPLGYNGSSSCLTFRKGSQTNTQTPTSSTGKPIKTPTPSAQ